jgi:hypothetical protein
MATYSLAAAGVVAGGSQMNTAAIYKIPDLDLSGNNCTTPGGMQLTMFQGDVMLVKRPDGSFGWYKYDAERSTPANPILIAVGP